MLKKNQAIGIFDSGIGGLTVANAILSHLPQESIIYFGDTAHLPYGDKSADAIRYYCLRIAKFLMEKKCKLIVVACNSASSVGYDVLLDFFQNEVLFVNVVDPLVQATLAHDFRNIGLIATKATVNSGVYQRKFVELAPQSKLHALATPLLAPMIEEGFVSSKISNAILETYLGDAEFQNIEALLLACTHYPLIRKEIEAFFDHKVMVMESGKLVAERVKEKLQANQLLNEGKELAHQFFVSDYTPSFEETAHRFYSNRINLEYCNIW